MSVKKYKIIVYQASNCGSGRDIVDWPEFEEYSYSRKDYLKALDKFFKECDDILESNTFYTKKIVLKHFPSKTIIGSVVIRKGKVLK